jgi:phosphatidylinositol alpha-1,6-mannosyltransferase
MEILVITWNYPPRRGGIENLLKHLCAGLREKHRVFVITSFAKAPYELERDIFRAPLAGLVPFALYALWCGTRVLAGAPQISVVLGGSALVTPLVLILARLFCRRAVVLTHGLDVIYPNPLYQRLCVRWLKWCDRVVANSRYTASLAQSKAVAEERLMVIPPGVHAERFNIPTDVVATRHRWNIEGKKIILFVGRLARRKGVQEFIESSLVEIVREVRESVFLIVGDNPTESLAHRDDVVREINATVSRLRLEEHVRWLGSVSDDDLVGLYQACDVVVLPVLATEDDVEGFGIVALEAAAAGKPVVATRVGGIPDAVEDGKSGMLVDAGDYKGLREVVIALLRNPEFRLSFGQYGRPRVGQDFSWQRIIGSYEDVLNGGEVSARPACSQSP